MWVSAIHGDSQFQHAHVLLNRVSPESGECLNLYYDYNKLSEFCRQQEMIHGWTPGTGLYAIDPLTDEITPADRITIRPRSSVHGGALASEKWTGILSFQSWVAQDPAQALRGALLRGEQTWNLVHDTLASYDVSYEPSGRGARLRDLSFPADGPGRGRFAKASHMGLEFSLKKLELRLGPFRKRERRAVQRQSSYQRELERGMLLTDELCHPDVEPLYRRYIAELGEWSRGGAIARAAAWRAYRRRASRRTAELRAVREELLEQLQGPSVLPKRYGRAVAKFLVAEEYAELKRLNREERAAITSAKAPSRRFRTWLKELARAGDVDAANAIVRLRTMRRAILVVAQKLEPTLVTATPKDGETTHEELTGSIVVDPVCDQANALREVTDRIESPKRTLRRR
jgi:hypothetical protein